jgi:hypothetical protein
MLIVLSGLLFLAPKREHKKKIGPVMPKTTVEGGPPPPPLNRNKRHDMKLYMDYGVLG